MSVVECAIAFLFDFGVLVGWSVVQFSFIFLIGSSFGQAGARRDGQGRACGGFGVPLVGFGLIWGRFWFDLT